MRIRRDNGANGENNISVIALVSDALAHPVRINMFRYILKCNRKMTPVCNKDLISQFGYAQATTSQHVAKLTEAGLVTAKREKKNIYLYANPGKLQEYIDGIKKFGEYHE